VDRGEFNVVFAAHFVRVVRFVERRTSDAQTAEDIAAETFLVAWAKRDQVEVTLPWLYRTAANKIGDHYRRSQRKRVAEAALSRLLEEPAMGVPVLDRLALTAAISALNPREREVVMLTYWERLTAREVGEVIGRSESAVWVTLTRAREKMRGHLAESIRDLQRGDHAIRR
jgi:RNA polymerase sigma-70 factor (ECF subfamily)